MAEVAGLVVGGVGLAGLFDSCMNAFEYVDSGANHGREYNRALLKISLLRLRLTRWKEQVLFVEDQNTNTAQYSRALVASPEESDKVGELLGYITADFEEAEKRAKRYRGKETPVVPNLERTDTTIAALTKKVQKLALTRQKAASMRQKASWALHDSKKFESLIEDQTVHINALVDLFPAMEIKENIQKLADSDAITLVAPTSNGEIEGESLKVLQEASQEVDPAVHNAAQRITQSKAAGHTYGGTINYTGKTKVLDGDWFQDGYTGPVDGKLHNFTGTYNAKEGGMIQRGNLYGGKSIWDD